MPNLTPLRGVGLVVCIACASPRGATAAPASRTVTVGPQYGAGRFHAALLGKSYRALWTTQITVTELDLASEAGGLTPVRRVGGQQTKGLAMRGADGRSYTFRSIDKDPSNLVPEELLDTMVGDLVRDQMAAQHPAAALIAEELARAARIPATPVRFVVMPDDSLLGGFRTDFGGLIGTFSEYPTAATPRHPGFEGADEIIDHLAMFARLAADPHDRVAAREYLEARLFDVLISDFDRHRKQWRWARRPGDPLWHPVPEDRDQAFARYEGLLVRTAGGSIPQLCSFGPRYDGLIRLTWNGREQDRWLLPELSRDVWIETARQLRDRIDDAAIERAARRMPPEWYALDGARLVEAIKARRDGLEDEADRYYRFLAEQVDVQGTDQPEVARVRRFDDGQMEVVLSRIGAADSTEPPYFRRRFMPGETHEVRLYLRAGDDRVESEGRAGPIVLRVIGGPGSDVVDDARGGGTRLYDSEGVDRVVRGPGTVWDPSPYAPPSAPPSAPWMPPRDWGRDRSLTPWLAFGTDVGVLAGGAMSATSYGFRRQPFAIRNTLRAGWAFGPGEPHLEYEGRVQHLNSAAWTGLLASYSGLEVLNYFGFGNDTRPAAADSNRIRQRQVAIEATSWFPLTRALELAVTPAARHVTTAKGQNLIGAEQPYGSGDFGEIGVRAHLRVGARAGRVRSVAADSGNAALGVEVLGEIVPKAWDVEAGYGWLEERAVASLTERGDRATIALHACARQLMGDHYPYFAAASIAGGGVVPDENSVRGLPPNRFIGDRSLLFNGDVRCEVSKRSRALPCPWGVLAFGDAGRVWLESERSNRWHSSWGGGPWVGLPSRANPVILTFARSDERTAYYLRAGFSF